MHALPLLKSLLHAVRLWHSGLLDKRAYLKANPDVAGKLPVSLHWSLFGRTEGRKPGGSPEARWLLSALDHRAISTSVAKSLYKIARSAPDNFIEKAADNNLNVNDLAYLRAVELPDIEQAIKLLPALSPAMQFEVSHVLADRHMRLDGLPQAMDWASKQDLLSLRDAVRLSDMARALGCFGPTYGMRILDALAQCQPNTIDQQVFEARLPVFETNDPVASELRALKLISISPETPGRCGEFARAVGTLAPLLNAATRYAVTGQLSFVYKGTDGKVEISDQPTDLSRTIRVRLLMPNYWLETQRKNRVTGPIFDLYTQEIHALLTSGWTLQPIHATPIFNISADGSQDFPTLSYHTCSPENETHQFIHFKETHLPGYFSVDHKGFAGWSSLTTHTLQDIDSIQPEGLSADKAFHQELYQKFVASGLSKYEQLAVNEPDRPQANYVLATLQIPDDTVNFWAYMPTRIWLATLGKWCADNHRQLIVKRHPQDRSRLTDQLMEELKRQDGIYISKAPIHDLIANCAWLVTTNSGVGFEALLHLKSVLLCGSSDYKAATASAKTPEELVQQLDRLQSGITPLSDNEIKRFVRIYCQHYCATIDNNLILDTIQKTARDH